jgi:hypothetical protein
MRLGYSYWGFLGDNKIEGGIPISAPDGNPTYSWSIVHEALKRGWKVWSMQKDRDMEAMVSIGRDNFQAFSQVKRFNAYAGMYRTFGEELPELDVLLLEWRFPIPGRNTPEVKGRPGYQPDLERQLQLLEYYRAKGTKVIFWDLDHKLSAADEDYWQPHAIFEPSAKPFVGPTGDRVRTDFPFVVEDLLQFPTLSANPNRKLVYIGSRYERDDVITEWVKPASDKWPGQVEFWGNWLKTIDSCKKLWPNVSYNDRITAKDFRRVYAEAVCVPLLGKKSFLENGLVTLRPMEALLFGTIPIGLRSHVGIERYVQPGLVAGDGQDMIEVVETLAGMPLKERDRIRRENVEQLSFIDASHFIDKIEDVADGVHEVVDDQIIQEGE